jgi:glutamate dehydrogenase
MSDHEVNIKILLDLLVRVGVIATRADRNRLLAGMTDEVSELVLADNANQALALTLDGIRSARAYKEFVALTEELLAAGILNRLDDAVPAREELLASPARARGLARPLLCVMLGHVKNWAFRRLLQSPLPDAAELQPFLDDYFPSQMREAYRERFALHPLRREIIATGAVNYLINHAGVSFLHRVTGVTGRDVPDAIHAYLIADSGAAVREARRQLEAARLPVADEQLQLVHMEDALEQATIRLLNKEHVDFKTLLNGVRAV